MQPKLFIMNPTIATILDILKYTIPGIIVLIATYRIVNGFLQNDIKKKQLDVFQQGLNISLRLRLQAYERLALLIERINPREMIPRIYIKGMTAKDLYAAAIATVHQEFDYNLSQQIYVSQNLWNVIVGLKEQELALLNQINGVMPPDAKGTDFHAKVVDYIGQTEGKQPGQMAIELLNNEAKLVLVQQA